ncbi:unnamed protein product [Parascedosporium putredinis]|uniref:Major facilitator superfamily (MFS) profile domain-containing protein n=1 Tax=Parascedosporium putredinis TaxID=1442378 RepID=A0A9P1MA37_9PEZI|nr:unnamed protein product [Parascedosporium putredinis]CAI7996745.1 unnamed protein product [Parascedosporium putredinis]
MTTDIKDPQIEHLDASTTEKSQVLITDEAWVQREKKLVRRLDWTLMPMLWVLYLFNYLDRNNIAQAKLDTFEKDLGLTGNQFNVAVSILNVGYMLMQLPSNMILTRVRPSIYMPAWVAAWSVVSASTALVHNFSGLIAVRFILGITEAPFFPGAYYVLSCWYTKKELALRIAILYSGLVLATAISGLLAAGIFSGLSGARDIAGWRWLFIIEGVGSFIAAIVAFFVLLDYPESDTGAGKWLFTEEERKFAAERMARQEVSNQESNRSVWYGLKLACMDYRMWIFSFILISNHTAYGFNNFYPSIVRGFNLGSRTLGCQLLSQTPEKRACVGAIINLMSQLGNIWSPYFFSPGDEPRYTKAMILMVAFSVASMIGCWTMKLILRRDNKKLIAAHEADWNMVRDGYDVCGC